MKHKLYQSIRDFLRGREHGMDREAIGSTMASLNMLLLIKSPKELPHVKMNGVMLRHRLLKVQISQI